MSAAQTERFVADGQRVCPCAGNGGQPWAPERFCWWIESGNPHHGDGHACVCLVPVELWEPFPSTCAECGVPADNATDKHPALCPEHVELWYPSNPPDEDWLGP